MYRDWTGSFARANGAEEERMRLRFFPAMILAALVLPGSADAGILALGGHAGYFQVSDNGENNFYAGAHARLRLPLLLALEGSLDYRPSSTRTVGVPSPGTDLDVTTYPITVSALVYPMPLIYLLGGVGWYNTTIEFSEAGVTSGPASETNDNFGSHVGAGLEMSVGGNRSLNAGIRYVFLDYDVTRLDLGGLDTIEADYYSIQVGLTFNF
jgi:opacity protein-like surface antigen